MSKYLDITIGYTFVIGVITLLIQVFTIGLEEGIDFSDRELIVKIIVIWGFVGGLALWFWMLTDFFKNSVPRFKKTWGFLLFFGSYVVAVIYFVVIYSRRK